MDELRAKYEQETGDYLPSRPRNTWGEIVQWYIRYSKWLESKLQPSWHKWPEVKPEKLEQYIVQYADKSYDVLRWHGESSGWQYFKIIKWREIDTPEEPRQ